MEREKLLGLAIAVAVTLISVAVGAQPPGLDLTPDLSEAKVVKSQPEFYWVYEFIPLKPSGSAAVCDIKKGATSTSPKCEVGDLVISRHVYLYNGGDVRNIRATWGGYPDYSACMSANYAYGVIGSSGSLPFKAGDMLLEVIICAKATSIKVFSPHTYFDLPPLPSPPY